MKRQTIQRQVILETFSSMRDHPTAEQIYEQVHEKFTSISKSTVYRVLQQAAEDGSVRRVEVQNGPDRYDILLKPHYHIQCMECGRVDDVQAEQMPNPLTFLQDTNGYEVSGCSMLFSGLCRDCRKSPQKYLI